LLPPLYSRIDRVDTLINRGVNRNVTMTQIEVTEIVNFPPLHKQIISVLFEKGPITRNKLVQSLKRARTTIYDQLSKLMGQGLVRSFAKHDGTKRGRPCVLFDLTEDNRESIEEFMALKAVSEAT